MNYLHLAACYRIPIDYSKDPRTSFNWDGKYLNAKNISESTLNHEICHWIIASPAERKYPDYDLGPGPQTNGNIYCNWLLISALNGCLNMKSFKDSTKEEMMVCVLEFILESIQNLNYKEIMVERNFLSQDGKFLISKKDFNNYIKELKKLKVIDANWTPIGIKNIMRRVHFNRLEEFKLFLKGSFL
jgi:hypothetical protein